jgi:hypothetical protein
MPVPATSASRSTHSISSRRSCTWWRSPEISPAFNLPPGRRAVAPRACRGRSPSRSTADRPDAFSTGGRISSPAPARRAQWERTQAAIRSATTASTLIPSRKPASVLRGLQGPRPVAKGTWRQYGRRGGSARNRSRDGDGEVLALHGRDSSKPEAEELRGAVVCAELRPRAVPTRGWPRAAQRGA